MPSAFSVVSLLICTATTGYTAMLAGGLTDQSTDDPEFMEQAWKAATKVNEEANDGEYYMIPTKVLSAKTQVVSGVMFTSKVLFEESSCKKGDVPVDQLKASNCAPKEGGKRVIYEISVLSQPWLNSEQVGVKVLRVLDPDEQV